VNSAGRLAVSQRWVGPSVVAVILASVVIVLALNLNWKGLGGQKLRNVDPEASSGGTSGGGHRPPAGFREYPIGEEVEKNQIRIAAVYLPPVEMEGMPGTGSPSLIHLEADIHAMEGNRNGFPKDEFVPYLVVHYVIEPRNGGGQAGSADPIRRGPMTPMMARDGLHYGASIEMPHAGHYKLTYAIAIELGRHADRATGVEPWWKPFEVTFDWDYPGPPKAQD
jgi:periplasmic iron binding protein